MTTTKTLTRKCITLHYDDPVNPNQWASVTQKKIFHLSEDDGSDDYGQIERSQSCNVSDIAGATWLPNALQTWLTNH